MLQMIFGYVFSLLTGLLAISMFFIMFTDNRLAQPGFFLFIVCSVMSIFFAWVAGV